MIGVRDIEFEYFGLGVEFASRALGQRQPAAGAGQDDVGSFGLRQLCDAKCQRRIGEHTGYQNVLSIKDSHPGSLDHDA